MPQHTNTNEYRLLRLAGDVLSALGFLVALGGGVTVVIGIVIIFMPDGQEVGLLTILGGLGSFISGILWLGLGEGLHALRDIAINSWYWRQ
jgi:hypothetical protein